jgi:class 3 adenylate cyclase
MPPTTEERRLLTILFADLSGFSALSSELDPEEVKDVVNTCFTYLNKPIVKEGGTIHKYEGDLVIALFGLPVVHEDDPERAIRASLDMMTLIPEINRVLTAKLRRATSLDLHVGVNSGTVFVGEIGSQDKKEYTVMGDVVNIASRLKDVAPKGEIIVSEPVFRASRYLFDYEARPAVNLKGIKEPVRIYRPLKFKEHPEPKRGIKGLCSPMLGRDRELALLKAAQDRLYRGEGGVTFVLGAAGMGKTRLLDELKKYAASADPVPSLTLEGRCFSYGESMAYGPFIQILEQLLNVSELDTRETLREKLLDRVKSIFPTEWREVIPYLGYIFSVRFEGEIDEKVKFLDAQGLKLQIMIAIRKLFFELARQKPLLLVIDDYHWIDNESLALLEFVLDPGTAGPDKLPPALFIVLSRIEKEVAHYETKERLKRKLGGRFQEIVLQPLDTVDSTQLVYNLLNVPGITRGFKDRILVKAEGNPFYVEEIIRSLIDGGILVFTDGVWNLGQGLKHLDGIRIPDSVQAVIASRLDKLNQDTRDILQMAAVIGRNFYGPILEQLCSLDAMLLTVYLAALEDYEYIMELKRRPEAEYSFRHPLFQEVAYSNLLIKRRRELHRRIGELIEKIYTGRLDEFTDVLAYQYANSDDAGKALEWLKKAGVRAKGRYANDLAIGYFEKLARLIRETMPDRTGELAAACEALGDIYRLKAEYPKAERYYEEMFQAAGSDRIMRSRARRKVVPLRHDQGDYDGALKILDEV